MFDMFKYEEESRIKEGWKEGWIEGWKEGWKKGWKEGRDEERKRIITNMLN